MTRAASGASLTADVLAELAPHTPRLPCCRAAFVEGIRAAARSVPGELVTTRPVAARAALQALHADRVAARVERQATARRPSYRVTHGPQPVEPGPGPCCVRSLLRGAFMGGGSVNRPEAAPHLELLCATRDGAARLVGAFARLEVPAAAGTRRGHHVVRVRSAPSVGAALSVIGAQRGRLLYEDGRVVREMRGSVNRQTNAETANLRRAVDAAVAQADAARELRRDPDRWARLPPALREAADLRTRHPADTLDQLASRAGCSRPAMAGRLHRLVEEATGGRPEAGAALSARA